MRRRRRAGLIAGGGRRQRLGEAPLLAKPVRDGVVGVCSADGVTGSRVRFERAPQKRVDSVGLNSQSPGAGEQPK